MLFPIYLFGDYFTLSPFVTTRDDIGYVSPITYTFVQDLETGIYTFTFVAPGGYIFVEELDTGGLTLYNSDSPCYEGQEEFTETICPPDPARMPEFMCLEPCATGKNRQGDGSCCLTPLGKFCESSGWSDCRCPYDSILFDNQCLQCESPSLPSWNDGGISDSCVDCGDGAIPDFNGVCTTLPCSDASPHYVAIPNI